MSPRVIDQGRFELGTTDDGHRVLMLNGGQAFVWLRLEARALLVLRKPAFAPTRALVDGEFVLAAFDGGASGRATHLFLQLGGGFTEFVLPAGLPTEIAPATRIVPTNEVLERDELARRVGLPWHGELPGSPPVGEPRPRPPPDRPRARRASTRARRPRLSPIRRACPTGAG